MRILYSELVMVVRQASVWNDCWIFDTNLDMKGQSLIQDGQWCIPEEMLEFRKVGICQPSMVVVTKDFGLGILEDF